MSDRITKKIMLFFPECETESPIVYHLVKDYDLMINIFRAKVTPEEEGYLVLDITGSQENIGKAEKWLQSLGIAVNETDKGVKWNQSRCVQCGSCVPHCPTGALSIPDRLTMEIRFASDECIECLSCIKVCPYEAVASMF
ncbi:MAG: 4Fe-4S binding protein [Spirochaetales bacterium]|nr:4Fe-4S binding protein [Spirochaetales bacterium]